MSNLSQVKPGDFVMRGYGFYGDIYDKLKVLRVTKLHIIIEGGEKYRFNGDIVGGGSLSRNYIKLFDKKLYDEGISSKRHRNMVAHLNKVNWSNLSRDLVASVYAMLPKESEA
jgi:hypothetical protein